MYVLVHDISKDFLVRLAESMYQIVDYDPEDEQGLLTSVLREVDIRYFRDGAAGSDIDLLRRTLQPMSVLPEGQLTILSCLHWAHLGFPQIEIGHKLAASLMATTATKEILGQVAPPFRAFMIELPDKLLYIWDNTTNKEVEVRRIFVSRILRRGSMSWCYIAYGTGALRIWRAGVTTENLLPPDLPDEHLAMLDPFRLDRTELDHRTSELIGRLIVNICLTMSDPASIKKVGNGHAKYRPAVGNRRRQSQPVVRVFRLVKPVTHDCREAVGQYLRGERKKLSVQVLVAGHWKQQPHGTGRKNRKLIHVEPYWRGPEEAPIAIRPHVLKDGAL